MSTVLGAPRTSVAALETPTVAAFSAAFVVEPRRRTVCTGASLSAASKGLFLCYAGIVADNGAINAANFLP